MQFTIGIKMNELEKYFETFRENTIGYNQTFQSHYGEKRIVYADWIASGRLYRPIEKKISEVFGPLVGNTHSESSETGNAMTRAYREAHRIIKKHCNAGKDDVIITGGSGMTGMTVKFQRILGLKISFFTGFIDSALMHKSTSRLFAPNSAVKTSPDTSYQQRGLNFFSIM